MPAPPALETLCRRSGLSPFERDVLLLCAGVELDSRFAPLCAAAQGDPARPYPTFSLALAALPEPHWSALSTGRAVAAVAAGRSGCGRYAHAAARCASMRGAALPDRHLRSRRAAAGHRRAVARRGGPGCVAGGVGGADRGRLVPNGRPVGLAGRATVWRRCPRQASRGGGGLQGVGTRHQQTTGSIHSGQSR